MPFLDLFRYHGVISMSEHQLKAKKAAEECETGEASEEFLPLPDKPSEVRPLEFFVPQNFQVGLSSDGQSIITVFDSRLPTQQAHVLPLAGAANMAMQVLTLIREQQQREAAKKPKILIPGQLSPGPNMAWPGGPLRNGRGN